MRNRIRALMEYAEKEKLLPATGAELFKPQDIAFAKPIDYDSKLSALLMEKFQITLEQWIEQTKYMGEHYWPSLEEKHVPINNFIRNYAKNRGVWEPAHYLSYFYSLLRNAVKAKQLKRVIRNKRWVYTGV